MLNAVYDRVVGVDVSSNCVHDTASNMTKVVANGGGGEGNRVKVDWRWAGRARPRTVKRGGREQITRAGSGRSLGDGGDKL